MEQEGHISKGLEIDQGQGGKQPAWTGGFQVLSAEKYSGFVGSGQTVYLLKAKERKAYAYDRQLGATLDS